MKRLTERRARILRVRTIERRHAEFGLGTANAQVQQISELSNRINSLRINNGALVGECIGADLQAAGQTAIRLDEVKSHVATSLNSAIDKRAQQDAMLLSAKQRAKGMEDLFNSAVTQEQRRVEHKMDALRFLQKHDADGEAQS